MKYIHLKLNKGFPLQKQR